MNHLLNGYIVANFTNSQCLLQDPTDADQPDCIIETNERIPVEDITTIINGVINYQVPLWFVNIF